MEAILDFFRTEHGAQHTLSDVWRIEYWEIAMRMLIAFGIGGVIGLEREMGDHPAGFRTHILVCVGSALLVILSTYGFAQFAHEFNVRMDPARLAAQVVTGIGFLGAGTIMRTGTTISGLTTAASLWVVAALGLAVGAGFYFGALLTALLTIICLFLLNKLERAFTKSRSVRELTIEAWDKPGHLGTILSNLHAMGVRITGIHVESIEKSVGDETKPAIQMKMNVKFDKPRKRIEILSKIMALPEVIAVDADLADAVPPDADRKKRKKRGGKTAK